MPFFPQQQGQEKKPEMLQVQVRKKKRNPFPVSATMRLSFISLPLHPYKRSTPCPNVKLNDEWGDLVNCEQGDSCCYCHTRTEQQFHPEVSTLMCYGFETTAFCFHRIFCCSCRSTSPLNAMMSSRLATVQEDPSVLLPTMKVSLFLTHKLIWEYTLNTC